MTDRKTVTLHHGWQAIARDLGVKPENVLRRAGLPLELLKEEEPRITSEDYFRIWTATEEEAEEPLLAVRMAENASPEVFHPAIFAALCSPNLAVAAKRIAQYKKLILPVTVDVRESTKGISIEMIWDDPTVQMPPSMAGGELVFLTQIARIGTRERVAPVRVETVLPLKPTDVYTAFFGITPEPSDGYRVTFSTEIAHQPFLTASESLWKTFEPELQRRISQLESNVPLKERVRTVLLEALPGGETSIEAAARRLSLSTRTLQRGLKQEGTSYKEVVRKTREDLARHYVTKTQLAFQEISFLIGFEEPSSFFRAFRKWTGQTPESFRFAMSHSPA